MFAPTYMGDNDFFQMLSLHLSQRSMGLRPVFFVPCTLLRTWGTREEDRSTVYC